MNSLMDGSETTTCRVVLRVVEVVETVVVVVDGRSIMLSGSSTESLSLSKLLKETLAKSTGG